MSFIPLGGALRDETKTAAKETIETDADFPPCLVCSMTLF